MKCEHSIKVSEMLDNELSKNESEALAEHLEQCADCRAAEKDFQFLRREIRGLAVDRASVSAEVSVLRRRILVPVPALVSALLIIVVLTVLLILPDPGPETRRSRTAPHVAEGLGSGSLARFDGGGKTLIYKETRR